MLENVQSHTKRANNPGLGDEQPFARKCEVAITGFCDLTLGGLAHILLGNVQLHTGFDNVALGWLEQILQEYVLLPTLRLVIQRLQNQLKFY